jgi:hypothetical protein
LSTVVAEVNKSEMVAAIEQNIVMFRDSKSGKIYLPGLGLAVELCFKRVGIKDGLWFLRRIDDDWEIFDFPTIENYPKHIAEWL